MARHGKKGDTSWKKGGGSFYLIPLCGRPPRHFAARERFVAALSRRTAQSNMMPNLIWWLGFASRPDPRSGPWSPGWCWPSRSTPHRAASRRHTPRRDAQLRKRETLRLGFK